MATLIVKAPDGTEREVALVKRITSVGRDGENDVAIPDPALARTALHIHFDGKDYDAAWQTRQRGTGPIAEAIRDRFRLAQKRLGYPEKTTELDCTQFRVPADAVPIRPDERQLSLF